MLGPGNGSNIYVPLQKGNREIRILTLLPGSGSAQIQCHLHKAALDTQPTYEALSYAWGDLKHTHRIRLNNVAVNITVNLATALHYLRSPTRPLKLWIDALCIDQENDEEKSYQVGLMESIYKQCSQVYIWLGGPEPSGSTIIDSRTDTQKRHHRFRRKFNSFLCRTLPKVLPHVPSTAAILNRATEYATFLARSNHSNNDPFALIHHFHQNNHIYQLPCFYRSIIRNKLQFSENPAFLVPWNALCQLLQCQWWSRFWCVQEALLPKEALVVYGAYRVSWAIVKAALRNQQQHLTTCCSEAEKLMSFRYYFVPDRLLMETDPLFSPPATVSKAQELADLETLLRLYRYKDCKDARDKVFGILGTVDRTAYASIRPNYNLSVGEVYTAAMKAIITHHVSQYGLRFLTGEGFNSSNYNLPSWVRDLSVRPDSAVLRHEMTRMNIYNLYSASTKSALHGKRTMFSTVQGGRPCLRLRGRPVSKIIRTTPPLTTLNHRVVGHTLERWLRAAQLKLYTPPSKATQFWRTLLADAVYDSATKQLRRYDAVTDDKDYYAWVRSILWAHALYQPVKVRDKYVFALLTACYGRGMFVTAHQNLGMGCPTIREGDEVWILRGGRVPFVLRREELEEGPVFKLIGDCYLNEFMDDNGLEREQSEVDVILT